MTVISRQGLAYGAGMKFLSRKSASITGWSARWPYSLDSSFFAFLTTIADPVQEGI